MSEDRTDQPSRQRWNRPDASMSLLADLMSGALDPGYAQHASRGGEAASRRFSRPAVLLTAVVVVGLLFSTAVIKQRRDEPLADRHRQDLIAQVEAGTQETDRLQRRLAVLRRQTAQARAARLDRSREGRQTRERLEDLALLAGDTPVTGPGLRITVDDAASGASAGAVGDGAAADEGTAADGTQVLDRDLQQLVNALWAAGADAIAVDGQRLTSMTAIRAAGDAILVDYRPVSPPYVVSAVGDPETLEVRFADSRAGRLFRTLESAFGVRFDVEREDRMRLPGASSLTLHYAREVRQR